MRPVFIGMLVFQLWMMVLMSTPNADADEKRPTPGDHCPGIVLTPVPTACICGSTVGLGNDHDCGLGHEGPDQAITQRDLQ